MISDDKHFELITAALQRMTIPNSEVSWNTRIDNRQFDVLARVAVGLHSVLLAYEVKHRSRPVGVDAVEAFVTKARDANVNKATFVSTSGFQRGAVTVAKRHGIDLFTLSLQPSEKPSFSQQASYLVFSPFGPEIARPPEVEVVETNKPMNAVVKCVLHYVDGQVVALPGEPTQMTYCLERSSIGKTSLADLIRVQAGKPVATGTTDVRYIAVEGEVVPPDEFFIHRGRLLRIEIHLEGVIGNVLGGDVRIELTALQNTVRYENVFSGSIAEFPLSSLPVGEPTFTPGSFYFLENPLRYYYCEAVNGKIATIFLVESFQLGHLFGVEFTQDVQFASFYIPLDDRKILERLRRRLQRMKSQSVLSYRPR